MKFAVPLAVLLGGVATSVQAAHICQGFKIHTPTGDQPLVAGMTICPDDFPQWNVESKCSGATTSVITKLYDNTDKVVVRRGNDKTKANGFYWNINPEKYTKAADELIIGHEYCFYSYVDGANKPTQITCFLVDCPCEGCDDGNACNGVEYCTASGICMPGTPVSCPDGSSCDPLDGECKPNEVLRPCIAVIDESDNYYDYEIDAFWANLRALYPDRYFCLLQPMIPTTGYDYIHHPVGFDADPRVTFKVVNRDDGDVSKASDWFTECGFDTLVTTGIDFVALFIDTSGSMTASTVSASFAKFQADMAAAALDYCFVYDGSEDWINPFATTLGDQGGGGSCN